MTGCKIGKVSYKNGNTVVPFNKEITVYGGKEWEALNEANRLARSGEAVAIAVVVLKKNREVYHDFNKHDDINGSNVVGIVELLKDFVINWLKFRV